MARYIDADNIRLKGIPVFDQNMEVLIPLSDVRKALQMTPTADVQEVRHGRWENQEGYDKCSVCEDLELVRTNFCPNCGATMDGKE